MKWALLTCAPPISWKQLQCSFSHHSDWEPSVAYERLSRNVVRVRIRGRPAVACLSARVCRKISAATLARVHGQVRPGVAGASWCEDFIYRAIAHHRENGTIESFDGKRLTRCLRPRCYFDRWRQNTNTIRPHSAFGYRARTCHRIIGVEWVWHSKRYTRCEGSPAGF